MENCGIGWINNAGCSGAKATAEVEGGPGLVLFCWKLLQTAQEEPLQMAAVAAKAEAAGAVAAG